MTWYDAPYKSKFCAHGNVLIIFSCQHSGWLKKDMSALTVMIDYVQWVCEFW